MFRKNSDISENTAIAQKIRGAGARTQTGDGGIDLTGDGGLSLRVAVPTFLAITAAFYGAGVAGLKGGLPFHAKLGDKRLEDLLFSSTPPSVLGNPQADTVLAAAAQALAVCLLAGILPLCTKFWRRARDQSRGNMYISFWGMTVGLPFVLVFMVDFLWPILRDMASGF